MDEQEQAGSQVQFFLGDFNTRLRDIDERNKLVRERVLLLGKNLISSRRELEEAIEELRRDNRQIQSDLERIKKATSSLLAEFGKMVKRDEMAIVERMLKDFQPLEFMRKRDVEDLIQRKINETTKKTT